MRRTLTAIALTLVALPVLAQELEVARDVWLGDSLGVSSRIVAPSPDGRRVACVLEGGVAVREVRTGAWVRWIPCRNATGVAFSPDGGRLAISTLRAVLALDVATWKTERSWEREGADAIAFVSTDRLACALGAQVRIVSVEQKKITWLPNEGGAGFRSLVAHPPANRLAGVDALGRVLVWDSSDGKFAFAAGERAGSAQWSPEGRRLVVVKRLTQSGPDDPRFVPWGPWVGGGALELFDGRDGTRVELPASLRDALVQDATWMPDGRLVVLRAERGARERLAVVDLATGAVGPTFDLRPGGLREFNDVTRDLARRVDRVVASPDGGWLLGDGDIVWALDGPSRERVVAEVLPAEPHAVAFAPTGELVLASPRDLSVWDVTTRGVRARHALAARDQPPSLLTLSSSGRMVLAVDPSARRPRLLDLGTGREVAHRRDDEVVVAACPGAGDTVFVARATEVLAIGRYRANDEQLLSVPGIVALAASDDLLVVATRATKQAGAALRLYELPGCAPIDTLPRASDPCVAAVSSDAHLVATGHVDGTIVISDTAGEDLARIEAHTGPVAALAFTADGEVLLSIALTDPVVAAWDAWTGAPLGRLSLDDGEPTSLATGPAGRRFAVAISPGRVRVVDLR